jgi:hypothetical protein
MTNAPFLAIAIQRLRDGADEDYIAVMREMFAFVRAEGYGADRFYRDGETACYINIREWASPERAEAAHRDPRLREYWSRLAALSDTVGIYGQLEEIETS